MLDPRRQKFNEYVRSVADLMGLRDWTFLIHDTTPDDPRHAACVYIPFGRRFCNLYLSDRFLDAALSEQRATIVHELMHCHFEPMRDLTAAMLSKRERKIWNVNFEQGMDSASEAWSKAFPLPEFDDEKKEEEEQKQVSQLSPFASLVLTCEASKETV